jgi:hypothetical protein
MTVYKMAGQCGDWGWSLERKSRGKSRLEEACEASPSSPRAAVLMMVVMMI